jgi:hypothetical protein
LYPRGNILYRTSTEQALKDFLRIMSMARLESAANLGSLAPQSGEIPD